MVIHECARWLEWSDWSTCLDTANNNCAGLQSMRSRECYSANDKFRNSWCEENIGGSAKEAQQCLVCEAAATTEPNDFEPIFGEWHDWSNCNETCGDTGYRSRSNKNYTVTQTETCLIGCDETCEAAEGFPETVVYTTATAVCPSGTGTMTSFCGADDRGNGIWQPINYTNCQGSGSVFPGAPTPQPAALITEITARPTVFPGCSQYTDQPSCDDDIACLWDINVCKDDPYPGYVELGSERCDLSSCVEDGQIVECTFVRYFEALTTSDCRDWCDNDETCFAFSYFIIVSLTNPSCFGVSGKPLTSVEAEDGISGICMVKPPLAEFESRLPTVTPSTSPMDLNCVDDANCSGYASLGQCDDAIKELRDTVRSLCPIACGICEVEDPTGMPSIFSDVCVFDEIVSVANGYAGSDCGDYISRINLGLTSTSSQACSDCLAGWSESDASQFDCKALAGDEQTIYEIWQECETPDPILCTASEIDGLMANYPAQCGGYGLQLKAQDYVNIERETRCRCLNATTADYLDQNANCYPSPTDIFTLPTLKEKCEYDICDQQLLGLIMDTKKECHTTYTRIISPNQDGAYETAEFWALVCPCFQEWTFEQASAFHCLAIESNSMTVYGAWEYCSLATSPPSIPQPSLSPSVIPSLAPSIAPSETPPVEFVCISGRQGSLLWVNGQYERQIDSNSAEYWYADHGAFIFFSNRWNMLLISREYLNDARLFVSFSSANLREATINFWNDESTEILSPDPDVVFTTALCDVNTFSDLCVSGLSGFDGHYVDSGYDSWSGNGGQLRYMSSTVEKWMVVDDQNSPLAQCDDRPDQCEWEEWDVSGWIPSNAISVKASRCFLSISTAACVIGTNLFDGQYELAGEENGLPYFEMDSYVIFSSNGAWHVGESMDNPSLTCNSATGHDCYWSESNVIQPDTYVMGGTCPFSRSPTESPSTDEPSISPSHKPISISDQIPSLAPSLSCIYLHISCTEPCPESDVKEFHGIYDASGESNGLPEWTKESQYKVFYSVWYGTRGWIIRTLTSTDSGYLRIDSNGGLPPLGTGLWDYYPTGDLAGSSDVLREIVTVECITSEDSLPPSEVPTTSEPSPSPTAKPVGTPTLIPTLEPIAEPIAPIPTGDPTPFSATMGVEQHILSSSLDAIQDQRQWTNLVAAVLGVDNDAVLFFEDKQFDDLQSASRRRLVIKLNVTGYVTYDDETAYNAIFQELLSQNGVGAVNDRMNGMMGDDDGNQVYDGVSTYFGLMGMYRFSPTTSPTPSPTSAPTLGDPSPTKAPAASTTGPALRSDASSDSGISDMERAFYILLGVSAALCCLWCLIWFWFQNGRDYFKHTFDEKETIIFPVMKTEPPAVEEEDSLDPLVAFDYSGCTPEQLRQHLTECEQTLNYIEQQLHTLIMTKKRDPAKDPEIKTLSREQRRVDLNIMTILKLLYPEDSPEELMQRRGKFWNGEGLESDDETDFPLSSEAGTDLLFIREEILRESEDRDRQSSMGHKRKREAGSGYYVETEYVYRNRTKEDENDGEVDADGEMKLLEDEFITTTGSYGDDDTELHAWEDFLRDKREKIFELEDAAVQAELSSDFGDSVERSSEVVDPRYQVVNADPAYEDAYMQDYVSDRSVHSMNHLTTNYQHPNYAPSLGGTQSNRSLPLSAYASRRHRSKIHE